MNFENSETQIIALHLFLMRWELLFSNTGSLQLFRVTATDMCNSWLTQIIYGRFIWPHFINVLNAVKGTIDSYSLRDCAKTVDCRCMCVSAFCVFFQLLHWIVGLNFDAQLCSVPTHELMAMCHVFITLFLFALFILVTLLPYLYCLSSIVLWSILS